MAVSGTRQTGAEPRPKIHPKMTEIDKILASRNTPYHTRNGELKRTRRTGYELLLMASQLPNRWGPWRLVGVDKLAQDGSVLAVSVTLPFAEAEQRQAHGAAFHRSRPQAVLMRMIVLVGRVSIQVW